MPKMKRNYFFLLITLAALSLFITSSCADPFTDEVLHGVWKGSYEDTELSFTFNSDGTCLMIFNDTVTGQTDEIKGTFELDFSKFPVPLSIRNIAGLNHGLYTIVEFYNDGSVRMAVFSPRWRLRPIAFEGDSFMVLKRASRD